MKMSSGVYSLAPASNSFDAKSDVMHIIQDQSSFRNFDTATKTFQNLDW